MAREAFELGDKLTENLRAQPASPYLQKHVCGGATTLAEAQRIIATDWLAV